MNTETQLRELNNKVEELELLLKATIEVYSTKIADLMIKTEMVETPIPPRVISSDIYEVLSRLKRG
ncbi:hypothetical protein D3C86_2140150 [compost metagenome]